MSRNNTDGKNSYEQKDVKKEYEQGMGEGSNGEADGQSDRSSKASESTRLSKVVGGEPQEKSIIERTEQSNTSRELVNPNATNKMTGKKRFMYGGLGALVPLIINLAIVDGETLKRIADELINLFKDNEPYVISVLCIGYVARNVALFVIGGFWAWLNFRENDTLRVFQLGMIAPAILTSMINGANVTKTTWLLPDATETKFGMTLVAKAHADSQEPKVVKATKPTLGKIFTRGFFASPIKDKWWVIVASCETLQEARDKASEFNKRFKKYEAVVYHPYPGTKYYPVVIGSNMTHGEAIELRKEAISAGFPKDTYLWKYPG